MKDAGQIGERLSSRDRLQRHRCIERIEFAASVREAFPALPAVLARILPGGRIVGREYVALNPTRVDQSLGSFKIATEIGGVSGPGADTTEPVGKFYDLPRRDVPPIAAE